MKELIKWLDRRVINLQRYADELAEINTAYYPIKEWSVLKLIFFSYFTSIYTKIIPNYADNIFFIDLFAGPGVNKVERTGDFVLGSPIIAICSAIRPFTKLFLVEKERKKISALKERITYLSSKEGLQSKFDFFAEDCNRIVSSIMDNIRSYKGKIHYLAFIDPYGMEILWDSIEELLRLKYGDIILVFQTQEIGRVWGKAKGNPSYAQSMTNYFGDEEWKEARNRDELLELYNKKIENYRDVVEAILVKGEERNFLYHLIFATRRTRGRNPWLKAIKECKGYIENLGEERMIRASLNYLAGRSQRLF